ncbi:sugar phosphate isomerase/epimerase [Chryseolinea sp. T2]|uniref:sugar phosphate isomerase/epimerase family protein n=1 Tax=Chryseolinea sp. T2 TaxID=3129255 RepID=UPI00307832FE
MNIKLGVSTWLWTSPFTTESVNLFPKIKSMGYEAVEIPIEYPELIDGKQVRDALLSEGLVPISCGAFGPTRDLTHDDPSVHDVCFDYLRRCFELSNVIGATFVAGPMYSAVGKVRMLPPDGRKRDWERAVVNLGKVCQMASDHGMAIALEPLNRFESDMVNTAEDVVRLANDINHPAARVMLDSFHMSLEERNPEAAIVHAGEKLIHMQVSENYRGVPGTGQTPWQLIRRGLERINYNGVVSIESFTPEVKELAGAVCIWKHLAPSQDGFASDGYKFLSQLFEVQNS